MAASRVNKRNVNIVQNRNAFPTRKSPSGREATARDYSQFDVCAGRWSATHTHASGRKVVSQRRDGTKKEKDSLFAVLISETNRIRRKLNESLTRMNRFPNQEPLSKPSFGMREKQNHVCCCGTSSPHYGRNSTE